MQRAGVGRIDAYVTSLLRFADVRRTREEEAAPVEAELLVGDEKRVEDDGCFGAKTVDLIGMRPSFWSSVDGSSR